MLGMVINLIVGVYIYPLLAHYGVSPIKGEMTISNRRSLDSGLIYCEILNKISLLQSLPVLVFYLMPAFSCIFHLIFGAPGMGILQHTESTQHATKSTSE